MAIYTVSGASNDARMKMSNGVMDITNAEGTTASQLNGTNSAGYRFTSISLAQGAGIAKATLTLNLINIGGSGALTQTTVYGENADNSATFTSTAYSLYRNKTNASYPLGTVPASPGTFTIDVTRIVQEIVNRKGWVSGNALSILLWATGTTSTALIDPWRQDMYPATLEITAATSTAAKFPTIATNDSSSGNQPWNNLANLGANDGSYTTSNFLAGGDVSQILKTSGYGFTLPQSAKINGIQVKVKRVGSNAADGRVQLLKAGSYAGYLYASDTTWSSTATTVTYGGANDLWGENWTYGDINDPAFGFAIQSYNTHGGGSASIDSITVTVFYNNEDLNYYKIEQAFHPVDFNITPSGADYVAISSGNQAYGENSVTHAITNYQGEDIDLTRIRYHFAAISGTYGGDPKTGSGGTYYDRTGIPIVVRFYNTLADAGAKTNILATRYGTLKSNFKEAYDYYLDTPITVANGATIFVNIEANTVSGASEPGTIYHYGSAWYNNGNVDDDPNQKSYKFVQGSGSTETQSSLYYELYSTVPAIPDESAFPVGDSNVTVSGYDVQFGDASISGNSEVIVNGYAVGFGSASIIGDSKMYADRITAVGGSLMTVDGSIRPLAITKTYQYKVYDQEWNFLGVWDDVVSNFGYSQEINSAGAAINVTLARNSDTGTANYDVLADDSGDPIVTDDGITLAAETQTLNAIGPGTNVDLNLNVKIYEFSSNTLDVGGDLVFTGYISMYTSQYGSTENTVVSIFSYGADLDNYVLMDGNNTRVPYLSQDPSSILTNALDRFNADGGIISYFKDSNPLTDDTIDDTGTIVTYTFNANTMFEVIKKALELAPTDWFFYPDLATNLLHFKPRPTTPDHYFYLGKHVLSLSLEKTMEGIANDVFFTGGKPTYSVLDRMNGIAGTNLSAHTPETGLSWIKHPSSAGTHSVVLTDANRIRGNVAAEGIYYNTQAIPSNNYIVEADFTVKSLAGNQGLVARVDTSAMNHYLAKFDAPTQKVQLFKCIAGAYTLLQEAVLPTGKTLVVGQTRHMQFKLEGAQLTVTIDNEAMLDLEDRSILSGYYAGVRLVTADTNTTGLHVDNFQAGMLNTDNQTQIYKRYVDTGSIASYRRGVERISDNRVTLESSADVIVASLINRSREPRYRSNITISGSTYDIRSIKLGDLVGFRNFGNYVDDVTMQVVRIDYTPDAVQIQLDTLLPSVPKRLEDIKRNLNQEQVSDNPDAPDV